MPCSSPLPWTWSSPCGPSLRNRHQRQPGAVGQPQPGLEQAGGSRPPGRAVRQAHQPAAGRVRRVAVRADERRQWTQGVRGGCQSGTLTTCLPLRAAPRSTDRGAALFPAENLAFWVACDILWVAAWVSLSPVSLACSTKWRPVSFRYSPAQASRYLCRRQRGSISVAGAWRNWRIDRNASTYWTAWQQPQLEVQI
jgi:hypothetical protein